MRYYDNMINTKITIDLELLFDQKVLVYDINRGLTVIVKYDTLKTFNLYVIDKNNLDNIMKEVIKNHD